MDWRAAIVTAIGGGSATIGFGNGQTGTLPSWGAQMPVRGQGGTAFAALKVGDILAVAPEGGAFALRSVPKISGGFVVEELRDRPRAGDAGRLRFEHPVVQPRHPGDAPAWLDDQTDRLLPQRFEGGMTPASIIIDGPFCVYQGARLGQKCFRNFGGGGSGPHTMRWGVEQSRNLMTVARRLADRHGACRVADGPDRRRQISALLSFALGAGETTVMRMVNAYSILANQGRGHPATLIDFVQDRHGKVIWPENWRACDRCNAPDWNGKAMPRPQSRAARWSTQ